MTESVTGTVYLVGAGPGDPGMITVRGVACLAKADVVLYDYLANPLILSHARPGADLVCVGKHGKTKIWTQVEINNELVRLAQQGKTVVRLKGGDPAVFARGAEEAEVLADHGLAFEIVPGVTAALAAGSCAGVPITHRDTASAAALVTGQQQEGATEPIDYAALARFPGTLVFYMGVTTIDEWTGGLLAAGKRPDTPVALIRRCSLPDQQTVLCTLETAAERLRSTGLRPPVVVIVGEVVQLAPKLSWFDRRALFGRRILVTRPAHQAAGLAEPLQELGAEVLFQPAIEISDPADWSPVDAALLQLEKFDWLVFSSVNGVHATLGRLKAVGRDLRALGRSKLAAVGAATGAALRGYHLEPDVIPERFIAEELAAALAADAAGKRYLLLRASRGREVLAETLVAAGAVIEQVVVYQSSDLAEPDGQIAADMASGRIDWVTVTSSAIARSLFAMFGDRLQQTKLASISPQTSSVLRELGLQPAAEAVQYDMPGVVQAILTAEKASRPTKP
ncbi:uroporphyrinogen-III C-methyltransferase [Lignipirellula cremea]|uniref:uroporphyrinogen-III C-methyltransferase n=1 Tax=Lignipirellula cremea TaxID=2528010 RepID=A0A518DUU3_9BACT|nr:uroporphyrinogen-III C-methyltransferase [Lignipirellula cremea]QDU95610.1 Uroporphyrinogen-III C-methyltransferase [Lignipirellula cremea]